MRSTLGTLRSVVLLSLGCALPVIVQAQAGELPNHEHRGASDASWQFEQCMGGVTYGAPLKWALSYGMGMVRESSTHDLCVLGAAKIGFGGAGFATGLASSLGPFGSGVAVTGAYCAPSMIQWARLPNVHLLVAPCTSGRCSDWAEKLACIAEWAAMPPVPRMGAAFWSGLWDSDSDLTQAPRGV